MKICVDRVSNKVVGLDLNTNPIYIEIEVDDDFELTKTLKKVKGKKVKINEFNQPLYKDNIRIENNVEVYEEVTNNKKPVSFEQRPKNIIVINEEGKEENKTVIVEEAVEFIDLEPALIDDIGYEIVNFKDNIWEFTLKEILMAKYKKLLNASQMDFIIADMFLNEEDLDLDNTDHLANTGVGILQLLPSGKAVTKTIKLENAANKFTLLDFNSDPEVKIKINECLFENNLVVLPKEADSAVIEFINTTNKIKTVKSYAIGY